MRYPRYPSLFQVNTRVYLSQLAGDLGRPATLDDVPDQALDEWAERGFDLLWFLGVWQTGPAGRRVSASNPGWLEEYRRVLPDFQMSDVCGSCFAIRDYRVHDDFGGDAALACLRQRLRDRGLRLILDFVPNHMAPDHPWASEHPDYFVGGTEEQWTLQQQGFDYTYDKRLMRDLFQMYKLHGRRIAPAGRAEDPQRHHATRSTINAKSQLPANQYNPLPPVVGQYLSISACCSARPAARAVRPRLPRTRFGSRRSSGPLSGPRSRRSPHP